MPFGGLCPLPLRLGGSADLGWTAQQFCRLAIDQSSKTSSEPIAVLLVRAQINPVILYCVTRGGFQIGNISASYSSGTNTLTVSLGSRYYNEDLIDWRSWVATIALASSRDSGSKEAVVSPGNTIAISAYSTDLVTIIVYGQVEQRLAGDYGADLNKRDSKTEGEVPYAWLWLLERDSELGTAYSTEPGSLTRFEAIATARMLALGQRIPEAAASQKSPECADGMLGYWCTVMGVPSGTPDWMSRRLLGAKMALWSGCTDDILSDALERIFGPAFVGIVHYTGDLLDPPLPTFWKYGTIGPAILALDGDGAWTSRRNHVTISLDRISGRGTEYLVRVANNELSSVLSGALPAVATWNWAFEVDDVDGFQLGSDELGRDAL